MLIFYLTLNVSYPFTFNVSDFSKCRTHVSHSEGKYTEFYEINVDEDPRNDSLVFDFHFSVLGRSDAHVLLAENDVLKRTDPVYEIVIGAGSNTFSELRRLQKSDGKVTVKIKDLLSAIEIRSFWIHVRRGRVPLAKNVVRVKCFKIYIQISNRLGRFISGRFVLCG